MALEKGEGAGLGPRAPARGALEEAGVAALADEVGVDEARLRGGVAREGGRGHERIVDGVDEQGRPADPGQKGTRARACPVVPLVGEAVEGRGHEPIVLGEGPRAKGGGQVEWAGIEALTLAALG